MRQTYNNIQHFFILSPKEKITYNSTIFKSTRFEQADNAVHKDISFNHLIL